METFVRIDHVKKTPLYVCYEVMSGVDVSRITQKYVAGRLFLLDVYEGGKKHELCKRPFYVCITFDG